MFDLNRRSIPTAVLALVVPFALACDAGGDGDQPGMQEQPPAQQQGQQAPQGQQPPGQAQTELSEEEIDRFADVYMELDEVRVETESQLQEAEGPEEQSEIQQQASADMEGILDDYDMTIQEYQRIAQAIETDPEQRERFVEVLEEKGGSLPQPQQQQQQPPQ